MGQLTALRAFDAAARHGSFTLAAAELGVSQGAISRLVRQLELRAGIDLFVRGHRQVVLSAAGRAFADDVLPAFQRLRQASANLADQRLDRPIVIAAPATTLLRWVVPRQAGLEEALAGVPVTLVSWDRTPDISDTAISMWLTVGERGALADENCIDIMSESFALVLAGDRLQQAASALDALAALPRLVSRTRPHIWADWVREGGFDAPFSAIREFERMYFTLQAAEAGIGSTIAPLEIVRDALDAGRLVAPFGHIRRKGTYYLVVPPKGHRHPALPRAIKWFKAEGQSRSAAHHPPA